MILSIFKLDDLTDQEPMCSFSNGSHNIGRGKTFQCFDKRVSRNHACITICDDKATLTAKHSINPVFYRPINTNHISILKYNIPSKINNGDTFGFFPDTFWFKIKIFTNESKNNTDVNNSHLEISNALNITINTHEMQAINISEEQSIITNNCHAVTNSSYKRENTDICESIVNKVLKTTHIEYSNNTNVVPTVSKEEVLNTLHDSTSPQLISCGNQENDAESTPVKDHTDNITSLIEHNNENDVESLDNVTDDHNLASCSGTNDVKKSFRDRCWYSDACYRKNMMHKTEFSHPGDDDFDSDPEDKRPTCSFGPTCYRRNKEHRLEYKHSKPTDSSQTVVTDTQTVVPDYGLDTSNILTNKRTRKKKITTNDESSEDDYDFKDPFIDDGSEDEYVQPKGADKSDSE